MSKTLIPKSVRIFEVGPRDGLQNEKRALSLESKIAYIERLIHSGLNDIEVGAFVREDKIPQMAQSFEIFRALKNKDYTKKKKLNLWALVPNEKGLERAIEAECQSVAVFTGVTNTFTQKNIGMTVKESLNVFEKIIKAAKKNKISVRGYLSVCFGCPYEGKVSSKKVIAYTRDLLNLGVEQVSLGDTIGVAGPVDVTNVLSELKKEIKREEIAGHFHDTRGTALVNCLVALGHGVSTLDSSSGGLGGCNYAPGASGNVATEDLVYMLNKMKIQTGVDLNKLSEASQNALGEIGRAPASKFLQAWLSESQKR